MPRRQLRHAPAVIEIHEGDTRKLMAAMPANSVHCAVTSPPYFNMRDYGVKGQIGLELSIQAHIRTLTQVFNLVHRVLRPDGTLWLNYGDSYAEGGRGGHRKAMGFHGHRKRVGDFTGKRKRRPGGRIKNKDLIGMPWRLALSLQAQGWWLRSCIIWEKPSCMPESAKDRPTVSHEYVFLLSKSRHYHYDGQAIAEPRAADTNARATRGRNGSYAPPGQNPHNGELAARPIKPVAGWQYGPGTHKSLEHAQPGPKDIARDAMGLKPSTRFGRGAGWREEKGDRKTFRGGGKYTHSESFSPNGKANAQNGNRDPEGELRNARTVWRIPAEPTPVAHFATFPTELARRCLAAGCPPGGTAFDPFGGYGTVGLVADRLQKHAILHELNPAYIELARKRLIAECPLLCEVNVYGAAIGKRERAEHVLGGAAKVAPSTGSRDRPPGSPG